MNFKDKKIYTIATAHLDTVWNWDFEHVINVCLKETLEQNFALFEKYPDYRFNFEGAYRYELFEEYYPEKFEELRKYVEQGKWNITGSAYENGDVNVPSPESLFRNMLYGNLYFEKKFGKRSNDIFLPDCFGFGWALPAVAEHSGLKGFSTQKLSWGSAYGLPFDIGVWYGSNGKRIFASLDSKSYCTTFKEVRTKKDLVEKLNNNISRHDLPWTLSYHGVGDVGGAPKEESVITVCNEISSNETNDVKVLSSTPTEFFDDLSKLSEEEIAKLPTWNNELVMTNHGVGSYISRAFSKRYNRKNEELADMAERAGVAAMTLCGAEYPKDEIDKGWKRTIAHTFHDDITGTSVQRVYQRSWNDLILSANQLSNAYEGATAEVIKSLDTSWVKGIPVVICNSIEQTRMSAVDITIPANGHTNIRVFDKNGQELPSQVNTADAETMHVSISAVVPSLGYKVVDVIYSDIPCQLNSGIKVGSNIIENFKYIVTVNENGDISSIIDKTLGNKEILDKPIRFELNKYKGAKEYPAWELTYKETKAYPWEFAEKGVCVVEQSGPVRATLKVVQKVNKSTFTYYVSLEAGCPWVSVYNEVEWREFKRVLHNGFSFTCKSPNSTYDLGLGTITRGIANSKLYSVAAQKWADITNEDGSYGVSVFSDSKYGWIMKDNHTLRLTVVHSPKNWFRDDSVQGMLDFGLNRYGYAIFSHSGKVSKETQLNARFFDRPLTAFISDKHDGCLGDKYSFGSISADNVIVRAIKKAEKTDEIIVRFNEGDRRRTENVEFSLGAGVVSAREVNAMEDEVGLAIVNNGKLIFSIDPYEVKTFALTLSKGKVGNKQETTPLELPFNADVVTFNHDRNAAAIPTLDVSIPGEIFPKEINCCGVKFKTGDIWGDGNNSLICAGQTIDVKAKKVYIVAASIYGDKVYDFKIGNNVVRVPVQSINERIGKWDLYDLAETANIKTDKLAWECTHTHSVIYDVAAQQLYFFMYEFNTANADSITLPDDNGLIILAAAQSNDGSFVKLATPLYDRIKERNFDYKMSFKERQSYRKHKILEKKTPNKT